MDAGGIAGRAVSQKVRGEFVMLREHFPYDNLPR